MTVVTPPVNRCATCSHFLCEFCTAGHKRGRNTKTHNLLSLEEAKEAGSVAVTRPSLCKEHDGEILKLFCETCDEAICRDCTIVKHREHKYSFVKDAFSNRKDSVMKILLETKTKASTLRNALDRLSEISDSIQSRVEESVQDITNFFNDLTVCIDTRRNKLINEAKELGKTKLKSLEIQQEELKTALGTFQSSVEFTEKAFKNGSEVEILSMQGQISARLQDLNSAKLQLKPCADDAMKFEADNQLKQDIATSGVITDVVTHAGRSTVTMEHGLEGVMYNTLCGQSVKFTIVAKEQNGRKRTEGGDLFLACCDGGTELEFLDVRDSGDGTYTFSYTPTSEGQYKLAVKLMGLDVRGSPFSWFVEKWHLLCISGSSEGQIQLSDQNMTAQYKLRTTSPCGFLQPSFHLPSATPPFGATKAPSFRLEGGVGVGRGRGAGKSSLDGTKIPSFVSSLPGFGNINTNTQSFGFSGGTSPSNSQFGGYCDNTKSSTLGGRHTTTTVSTFGGRCTTTTCTSSAFAGTTTTSLAFAGTTTTSLAYGAPSATSLAFGAPSATGLAFGAPSATSLAFGAPSATGLAFGAPSATSLAYGAPSATGLAFGAPSATSLAYGAPSATSLAYGAPSATGLAFGAPSATSLAFGAPSATGLAFGAPSATGLAFGAPSATSLAFGGTTTTSLAFGAPSATSLAYGAPSATGLAFGAPPATSLAFGGTTTTSSSFGGSSAKGSAFGSCGNTSRPGNANRYPYVVSSICFNTGKHLCKAKLKGNIQEGFSFGIISSNQGSHGTLAKLGNWWLWNSTRMKHLCSSSNIPVQQSTINHCTSNDVIEMYLDCDDGTLMMYNQRTKESDIWHEVQGDVCPVFHMTTDGDQVYLVV